MVNTQPFLSTRSPASYHRAVAPANFLKTHAIAASVNQPWSPRAFQKISDSTAQWFPLGRFWLGKMDLHLI
jgi:hypothetical protein